MSGAELEQFRKRTRWVYYREGVAYGPFSVDEIIDMINEGVLNRETELMELGSNRRVPLGAVRIFLECAEEIDERHTREMDEAEFESTRQRLGRSRGVQFYVVNIALPLALILAVVLGVFWKQIVGIGVGGDPGAIHVVAEAEDEASGGETPEAREVARAAEAVFVEAETSLEGGLEDYALGLTMEGADDGTLDSISAMPVPARAKKLPKVIELAGRRKPRTPTSEEHSAAVGPAAVVGGGVVEIEFSDEELDGESEGVDGDEAGAMVRRRLRPVLRRCASKASTETGLPPDVMARVGVRPSGSLGGLKLTVEPKVGYSEIRMCIIAGMAGIRVPPFEGPELQVTTTN